MPIKSDTKKLHIWNLLITPELKEAFGVALGIENIKMRDIRQHMYAARDAEVSRILAIAAAKDEE